MTSWSRLEDTAQRNGHPYFLSSALSLFFSYKRSVNISKESWMRPLLTASSLMPFCTHSLVCDDSQNGGAIELNVKCKTHFRCMLLHLFFTLQPELGKKLSECFKYTEVSHHFTDNSFILYGSGTFAPFFTAGRAYMFGKV